QHGEGGEEGELGGEVEAEVAGDGAAEALEDRPGLVRAVEEQGEVELEGRVPADREGLAAALAAGDEGEVVEAGVGEAVRGLGAAAQGGDELAGDRLHGGRGNDA